VTVVVVVAGMVDLMDPRDIPTMGGVAPDSTVGLRQKRID